MGELGQTVSVADSWLGSYPNHDFTALVLPADRKNFGDLIGLNGKTVRVTGKIEDYRGKPEIKLTAPDQLVVLK